MAVSLAVSEIFTVK